MNLSSNQSRPADTTEQLENLQEHLYAEAIINIVIWKGRKPRIKVKYLKLPKEMGGLDLPNLQAYYRAAQVGNVKVWMQERWREMEVNCGDIPLTVKTIKSYLENLDNRWVVATAIVTIRSTQFSFI